MKKDKILLTIAIPTYNRPSELRRTLLALLPQLDSEKCCRLVIIDNCSDTPAKEVYDGLDVPAETDERVFISRNATNIGMGPNFLRCFESCLSDHLWILSDDDLPLEDALKTILGNLSNDACFTYYAVPSLGTDIFKEGESSFVCGKSYGDLHERFSENYIHLAFISTGVYKMSHAKRYLRFAYSATPSLIPHVLLIFKMLQDEGVLMLSRKSIAQPNENTHWGLMNFVLSTGCLLNQATTVEELSLIRRHMMQSFNPNPKVVLFSLLLIYPDAKTDLSSIRYVLRILKEMYSVSHKERFHWNIVLLWSYFPSLFKIYRTRKTKKTTTLNGDSNRI